VDVPSGKVNWTFSSAFPDPQCESRKSPVTDGVDVYFFTHDNNLHALAPSGRSLWSYKWPGTVFCFFRRLTEPVVRPPVHSCRFFWE